MKIFLDSSKIEEAKRWMPAIEGATTNPSILLKEGTTSIYEFCKMLEPKPVSIEACGDFATEARIYHSQIPNAVIKVPLLNTEGGNNLILIKQLSEEGIKINCTALMSLSQVILAAKAGARYVSLFAGRVDDEGGDYHRMISDCVDFLDNEDTETELIVGSIRTVGNVLDAVRAGAHIVTIPPNILGRMLMHRFSLETVRQFEADNAKLSK
ncbi:Transaldolase [subsurface metagenome]